MPRPIKSKAFAIERTLAMAMERNCVLRAAAYCFNKRKWLLQVMA